MSTHAIARVGIGGTAALATTQIGADITMPAGGPWKIHHLWGQVAKATTLPDEGSGGALILRSVSGDIDPDPSPGQWPLIGSCISESANASLSAVPLNLWETILEASGKASIQLSYLNQLAITTASQLAVGIIFGTDVPEVKPAPFCAYVQSSFASAAEQSIGTITLAEKATKITGVLAVLNKGDASTTAIPVVATIRLGSQDIKLPPSQYPCCFAFNASDGTAVGQSAMPQAQFIPVDIPVVGGAVVDVFATTTESVTGNADVSVYLKYE